MRNGDVSFSQFAQLYRSLMFDAQKNVSAVRSGRCKPNLGKMWPEFPDLGPLKGSMWPTRPS